MLKCVLIYLWIYIGLFYVIEAGDDDEHVHIKLHMTSGQRKRAQIQLHTQHHKKRHSPPPHSASNHHHHSQQQLPPPPPSPSSSSSTATNLYHESPHNYLTGITSTSSSLEPQQHIFRRTKKYPSSALLHLHENGQVLNIDEEVNGQGDVGGGSIILNTDTDVGEHTIPSYLAKNFALFPQPTTTYETEIIPHNSEGFNAAEQVEFDGLDDLEEENEIPKHAGRGAAESIESIMLTEQMENYQRHKPSSYSSSVSSSSKIIKNEQLLQQLLQQQQDNNEEAEIMNAAAYKSTKLRGNKYRAEKDYHSEDDMTEAMMYSSKHNPTHNFKRDEEQVAYRDGIKPLTVDDIWSQLQQQYLNKYSPQAQTLTSVDNEKQPLTVTATKTKLKHKRNTKRQRLAKPTIASYPSSWPVKTLSYVSSGSKHHKHQLKQPQLHYNDEILSLPSAAAFSSGRLSSHRDTDLFAKRPFNKFTAHDDEDDIAEIYEDSAGAVYGEESEDDDVDVYGDNSDNNHDESFEEAVYQRGKKFTGHTAYGQHSHTNNPFNYHDLYGSYSTPITATVATNIQPSTYHPNMVSSTLPSYTATSSTNSLLSAISQHPSTSYQWRTQQNYPASYQTYHLQHQQQQPERSSAEGGRGGGEQYAQHHQYLTKQQTNAAVRLPKATITQTPNTSSSSKLSPTQSNDFTVSTSSLSSLSSSLSSAKSTVQPPPARYKKRKNRIKTKRNRIVVI